MQFAERAVYNVAATAERPTMHIDSDDGDSDEPTGIGVVPKLGAAASGQVDEALCAALAGEGGGAASW